MKQQTKELVQIQKKLVDEILTNPDRLEKLIDIQLASRKGFHHYSARNLLLADYQLRTRTGEGIELLAGYKKWQKGIKVDNKKIHRHVKKGEKALKILIPYTYTTNDVDPKTGEEIKKTHTYFKLGNVFDVSQTEGDALEVDFTRTSKNYTLEEIINRGKVHVNFSNKELTRGYTNGKEIWISKHISTPRQICTYFHELAHYLLHFDNNRNELDTPTKELEAEAVSFIVSYYIGIENEESSAYIHNWNKNKTNEEKLELLKGKGSNVLKTATKIINDLKLDELLDSAVETGNVDIGVVA